MEVEDVHDVLNLELLVAAGLVEDVERAGVGRAGGVRGRERLDGCLGVKRDEAEESDGGCGEEADDRAHGVIRHRGARGRFCVGLKILHPGGSGRAYRQV